MRIGQAWAELLISFMKKLGPLQSLGQEILNALVELYRGQLDQTGFLHFLKFPQSKNSPART
jgi:hypothetical protein